MYRVQWTFNGNDISFKDFSSYNKAVNFRDWMENHGAGVQRIIDV